MAGAGLKKQQCSSLWKNENPLLAAISPAGHPLAVVVAAVTSPHQGLVVLLSLDLLLAVLDGDTVVALQALALYSTLVFSPEGSSTVTVQSPSSQLTFDVNQNNKLLYQEELLKDVTGKHSLEVKGTACASVQEGQVTWNERRVEVFGEGVLDSPPECDRAHRTLTEKPKPGQRARPVIIRLHRYQVKERIIREARARRGKLQYRGSPISIYEDYAPEVVAQRQKYREVMSELYNLGFKPALLFPARLVAVMKDGERKRFSSVAEAKHFITSTHTEEI
ncbi:hypothetical protein D5F01_LYC06580 [Larimichthys crocea]|uniref:LINE-1 type transposase domain-containing protein 1 n=1 Tax=Larimichthys crocea TaxID=215358 RepID=A0A6G0IVU5_LARCR|nr:hypothetical protein D5F01_LYC06580 [Larimichthys crocea]